MKNSGFTLVELMVTLAVAAILATVALPGFTSLIQTNRVTTQTNELVASLNLARSEAIRRGLPVTVTAIDNNFANGWNIHFEGENGANTVLRTHPAMRKMTVTTTPAAQSEIIFNGRGFKTTPAAAATLDIIPAGCASGTADRRRTLNISNTGRINVTRGAC